MKRKYNLQLLITILLIYNFPMCVKAQDSLYLVGTFTGETTEQRIRGANGIGDINGDGYDDFLISVKTANTVSDQGIVKLYFGSANGDLNADIIFHYPGSDNLNDFGGGYGIGDVNNDGYDDFILRGVFGDWGFPKGKVFLYYGGVTIDTVPAAEFYQFNSIQDSFGKTTKMGDINKDGYDDFAISSIYNWTNGGGYVYLFWGGDTISWERSTTFTSDTLEDFFGESIANIGDVNDDSYDDLAIGAAGGPSIDTAKVYFYYGGIAIDTIPKHSLIGGGVLSIGDINGDGRINFIIRNEQGVNVYFDLDSVIILNIPAQSISNGDIDNDGYSDLLIGNQSYINSDSVMVGGAFIYLGGEDLDTVYTYKLEGENKWDQFSAGMATADINGDGYDELFIFASGYPDYENPQGKIYIYSYRKITDVNDFDGHAPDNFLLIQNYPNPFNPSTTIKFALPKDAVVTLKVYDALGAEVTTIVNQQLEAGYYKYDWNASGYASGMYIYRLQAGEFNSVKKMVILK